MSADRVQPPTSEIDAEAGVQGNERLTALAGAVILTLSVGELLTVPFLRGLLAVHLFVGVALLGPLTLKTASTGWRFARYYTRAPAYQRKGPPRPLQRTLAPVLVVSTFVLIGSGIALAVTGPAPVVLIRIHVLSFLVWIITLVIHVVAYLRLAVHLTSAEVSRATEYKRPRARRQRRWTTAVSLVAGAIAAVFVLPSAAPWSSWPVQGEGLPMGLSLVALTVILVGVAAFLAGQAAPSQPTKSL